MQNRESSVTTVSRRVVVISPNAHMVAALEPILQAHLADVPTNTFKGYPSPRDLAGALASTSTHLIFLDAVSDREAALDLLTELARVGPNVQVVALLSDNDPDLILRCLRAGASDFLVQPFTPDQLEAALAKMARMQPNLEPGREPAKVIAVMPARPYWAVTSLNHGNPTFAGGVLQMAGGVDGAGGGGEELQANASQRTSPGRATRRIFIGFPF